MFNGFFEKFFKKEKKLSYSRMDKSFEWFEDNAPLYLKIIAGLFGLSILILSFPLATWLYSKNGFIPETLLIILALLWLLWLDNPFTFYKKIAQISFGPFVIGCIAYWIWGGSIYVILLVAPTLILTSYYGVFMSMYWLMEPLLVMTIGECFKDKMEAAVSEREKQKEAKDKSKKERELEKKLKALEIYSGSIDVIQDGLKGDCSVDQKFLEKNLRQIESLIASDTAIAKFFKGMSYRLKSRQEEYSIRQFDDTMQSIGDMMVTLHKLKNLPKYLEGNETKDTIMAELDIKRQQLEVERLELEVMQEKIEVQRLMGRLNEDEDD